MNDRALLQQKGPGLSFRGESKNKLDFLARFGYCRFRMNILLPQFFFSLTYGFGLAKVPIFQHEKKLDLPLLIRR